MAVNKHIVEPKLLFGESYQLGDLEIVPIKMKDILWFNMFYESIIFRKNSRIPSKDIIKMSYLHFIIYMSQNPDVGEQYGFPNLQYYYNYAMELLDLAIPSINIHMQDIIYDTQLDRLLIGDIVITSEDFDDIRRVIILQNGIDFDIDSFLNFDTEKKLNDAEQFLNKNKHDAVIEDYIDSLIVYLRISEDDVKNLSIRKFWRLVNRCAAHDDYIIRRTGEASGMVTYKEPIQNWMGSLDVDDKYENVKTEVSELKNKIG